MQSLAEKARALADKWRALDPEGVEQQSEIQKPETRDLKPEAIFHHEGDYWTVAYGGTVLRLKDSRSIQYVAELLRHPGREFLALDLVMSLVSGVGPRRPETTHQRRETESREPLLDAPAKAAYRCRLEELRDELEEAERFNDLGRAARAREEMDIISQQLALAVGLRGKDRLHVSQAERARQTVTHGIKAVIAKIRAGNPALARYLAATIATGYFCAYVPDPDLMISWFF